MADKKLNEVTKVTDMAYVPVIMADGSIGQIAKADLASVVAGYLPYITNLYTNEQDFNNIKKVGSYSFGVNKEGYSNIPNVQSLEGVLVVIISVSNSNIYQIYLGIQDSSLHIRSCYNGVWQGWRKVSA